jgi:hypothetical protein
LIPAEIPVMAVMLIQTEMEARLLAPVVQAEIALAALAMVAMAALVLIPAAAQVAAMSTLPAAVTRPEQVARVVIARAAPVTAVTVALALIPAAIPAMAAM